MTARGMAARRAVAQEVILQQAMVLAAMLGVDASGLAMTHKDPQVQALLRIEALATFLADVAKAYVVSADTARRKQAKGDA